jgi:lytic murein transglycosylase
MKHFALLLALITPASAQFNQCLEAIKAEAREKGISRATLNALGELEPNATVMRLLNNQPEFNKPFWSYLEGNITPKRIEKGIQALASEAELFKRLEQKYGVPRSIITAIWAIESNFGENQGEMPLANSLATLACYSPRADFFKNEWFSTLKITQEAGIAPLALKGSWAGAFGQTQFMPSTFLRAAVDGNGDGEIDLVNRREDALASTANLLKLEGWRKGETWGYEVKLPANFNYALSHYKTYKKISEWQKFGLQKATGTPFKNTNLEATLFLPTGAKGPAFLLLNNFQSLLKYNASESYALTVAHLADRVAGLDAFITPWPKNDPALPHNKRVEIQTKLISKGYLEGKADGRMGKQSREAIQKFQLEKGLKPADGYPHASHLKML